MLEIKKFAVKHENAQTGEQYRPAKRTLIDALCRMKKRKGWSAMNLGVIGAQRNIMTATDAAAASVPSSFTSTKALWTNFDNTRSLAGDMPENRRERQSQQRTYFTWFRLGFNPSLQMDIRSPTASEGKFL